MKRQETALNKEVFNWISPGRRKQGLVNPTWKNEEKIYDKDEMKSKL